MKAAVIGSPIAHSLSPLIFNFIAHQESRTIDYKAIEVDPINGKTFLQNLKADKDFIGVNVTLPLKEIFLEEINILSPEVSALGALNVLHFKDNAVHGHNTDIVGIKKTLEDQKFDVSKKSCFILGAGGSARAVAYVLGCLKAFEVVIFSRSDKKVEQVFQFANLFPDTKWSVVHSFDDQTLKKSKFDLIVNSTPLGMTGKESGEEFFKSLAVLNFNNSALAFDLIYTPDRTDFLEAASTLGLKTVGGLGMLIDQAIATWKIWMGELKNENELHQKLHDFLSGVLKLRRDPRPVFLTGLMGVGKSSVGAELSRLLGRNFFDTDKVIEEKAGLSISEIFKTKGEPFFRSLEQSVVLDLSETKNTIISLGGGALMDGESLKAVQENGTLVFLAANESVLAERVSSQNEDRPLLANLTKSEKVKKIKTLLDFRISTYQKAAIQIETDNLSLLNVVFEVLSAIGKMKEKECKQ